MEMLMEKLRSKSSQYKSFAECAKAVRMSQLEKRFPMDMADRSQLQKCLDTLLQSMSVNSLQGMVERLESISRQLSLKLMAGQTGLELFISSDMFYLEVSLEPSGAVKDVKVHHEGKPEQQSCEQLVRSLSKGDFEDFTTQLEGLISIYQLNAEKKVKCKAFSALCALEADLGTMWSMYSSIKDVQVLLNTSCVGILEKRRGGHPMKLTYFVSPYDALAANQELTVETINQKQIGCSVTICLEGSAAHKLQTTPVVTAGKSSGRSSPVYAPLTANNSTTLPAYFTLKLSKPQPMCVQLLEQIAAVTELECADLSTSGPIFSLITRHVSQGKLDSANNRGLFVSLPDQVHCYFMTESKHLNGLVINSIPFTHPSQVPQILTLLRQQAVFNTLVASAVRVADKQDFENMTMLEITALSWKQMSVTFEHPLDESMATLELDLSDITNLSVKLYSSTVNADVQHMSRVLQRCISIPVTMRALIKSLEKHSELATTPINGNGAFSSAPNGGLGGANEPQHDFGGSIDTSKVKQEPGTSNGQGNSFDDFSAFSATVLESGTKAKKRKHKSKNVVNDLEVVVESSSSDSEREDRRPKKAKPVLDPKGLNTPSVTITPITGGNMNSVLSGIALERRPGIEIIPLTTPAPTNLPSSITITPISGDKDLKKARNLEDREKRKKRKRDEDSKMGPPEKVPSKNDPLSKPVSVSIKPATDSPPTTRPNSPSLRKYTSSPTQFRDKSSTKSNPSPKHSPVYSSPKHSPKHGTNSPKQTSGSSGKPSISAIKSASNSPTPKSSESKKSSSSKDQRERDPNRKSTNVGNPRIKSSSVKLKQLDLSSADITLTNISSCPADSKASGGNPLQRNRKGSLSAVIDKLKSAQEVVDTVMKDKITISSGATLTKIDSKNPVAAKVPDGVKNPTEYMVKPSSDGMKITINKTRSKESSKSGSNSKAHTGLKPGVVSGPASKKSNVGSLKSGSSPKLPSIAGSSKGSVIKPISKLPSKGSNSPKLPSDLSRKDPLKPRPIKPEKNIFKEGQRKGSPTSNREDDVMKVLKFDSGLPSSMVKPFDTKFQIPKLSARNNPSTNTTDASVSSESSDSPSNNNNNITKMEKTNEKSDIKVIDTGGPAKTSLDIAANLKYQSKVDSSDRMAKTPNSSVPNLLSLPIVLTNISPKLPLTSPNLPTTSLSSITSKLDRQEESDPMPPQTEVRAINLDSKIEVIKPETPKTEEISRPKSSDAIKLPTSAESTEILLDFSTNQGLQAKLASVDKVVEKGVGSVAPCALPPVSPRETALMVVPSPRTPSGISEEDKLMDEALMMPK